MKAICFGDSNTYGYDPRAYFGGRYPRENRWVDILADKTGWEVHNQGENGRSIPASCVSFPPDTDLLILMLGTNDLLQGATPRGAAGKMKRFLQGLALAREKIFLVAPPPMAPGEWVPGPALVEASLALAGYYEALACEAGVGFADAGAWNVGLAYDGVHFTGQGHRAFAAGLYRALHR